MQLTRFTDYSLRVLIFLAHRQGIHTTIKDVSDAHQISEDHLMKVVRRLATLGYIKTTRGKNGGVGSARAPADISIGAVIRDVETLTPVECFTTRYGGRCLLYPNCALRGALQSAQLQYLKTLDTYSIADVMGSDPLEGPRFAQNGPGPVPPPSSRRRTGRTRSRLRARAQ
ncbi:MAG: Rrf2 family transcriptional regulator [Steroidobacteraceae bacterium]